MTSSNNTNGLSSQDFNQRVQEIIAEMGANYQDLLGDLEGVDYDNAQIALDQANINAKTQVEVQYTEHDQEGKTVYDKEGKTIYMTQMVTVNKYSDTQIQAWQDDIERRQAHQESLQEAFNQSSEDLQKLASLLATLFIGSCDSASDRSAVNNLNIVIQNLRQLFKEMQNKNNEQFVLLQVNLKEDANSSKAFESENLAASFQGKVQSLSTSLQPNGQNAPVMSAMNLFVPSRALVTEIRNDLLPIFLAFVTGSPDLSQKVDATFTTILNKPNFTVKEKQLAFLTLSLLLTTLIESQDQNQNSRPKAARDGQSQTVSFSSVFSAIQNDVKAVSVQILTALQQTVPSTFPFVSQAVIPASAPLSSKENSLAISAQLEVSDRIVLGTSASKENRPVADDTSIQKAMPVDVNLVSNLETAALLVTSILENIVESAASTTLNQLSTLPVFAKEPLQLVLVVQTIRSVIGQAVEIAVQKTIDLSQPAKRPDILLPQFVTAVIQNLATLAAQKLVAFALSQIDQTDEFTPADAIQLKIISQPLPVLKNSTNGGLESAIVSGDVQQFLLGLDQMIGSGTYSQLAVEGAFSQLIKSANVLQQVMMTAGSDEDAIQNAITKIGNGENGGSINSLASESAKEQMQKILVGNHEQEQESEGLEAQARVAPDLYYQILAV